MAELKKILFVLPSLDGGGAERVFTHIINRIDRNKFFPILALGLRRGRFLDKIDPEIDIHTLGSYRARNLVLPLARLVWKLRPDVVFSTLGTNFALAAIKPILPTATRVILREGSSPTAFLNDVRRQSPRRAELYAKFYKYVYGRSDLIICQSDFMLDDIWQNFSIPPERLIRIYNPVDLDQIDASQSAVPDKSIPADGVTILAVGRLSFEKGYDVLLRAFSIVCQSNPKAKLILLGEGPEQEALERLTDELNLTENVRFAGFDDDPYRYMHQSDLMVLPSRYEGFSNVMAESWACGKAVVATDCPGANREIMFEGVNGWLAANEDPASLAEKIDLAIAKVPTLNAELIRESCTSRFSFETIIPQYEREFEK